MVHGVVCVHGQRVCHVVICALICNFWVLADNTIPGVANWMLIEFTAHFEGKVLQWFTSAFSFQVLWLPQTIDLSNTCFYHCLNEGSLGIKIVLKRFSIKLWNFNIAPPSLTGFAEFFKQVACALCHLRRRINMQRFPNERSKRVQEFRIQLVFDN